MKAPERWIFARVARQMARRAQPEAEWYSIVASNGVFRIRQLRHQLGHGGRRKALQEPLSEQVSLPPWVGNYADADRSFALAHGKAGALLHGYREV